MRDKRRVSRVGKLAPFRNYLVALALWVAAAIVMPLALWGTSGSTAVQDGPSVSFVTPPDGAEVAPGSQVTITARVTDPNGVASGDMFWQNTGNTLACPGTNNSDWRCTVQGDTYTWVLELSATEGTRTYRVRAADNRGNTTTTPDRTLRVTSQPTGISITLQSPSPGSTLQPGAEFMFSAEVRTTTSQVKAARVRFVDDPVAYNLSQEQTSPGVWKLGAMVAAQAPAGEHSFLIEVTSQSGGTATGGPYRIVIQQGTGGPGPGPGPGPGGPGNFPIFRYQTATLDDARGDAIVGRANSHLTTNDGSYDVACPLNPPLARQGSVQAFNFTDGNIDTSSEMSNLLNRPGGAAYVVNEINYCGGAPGPGFTILGCATTGAPIVVVRRTNLQTEGILWAHEYGHVKNLGHTDQFGNVMHSQIGNDHTMVHDWQCRNYQRQGVPVVIQNPQAQEQTGQRVPVLVFIRRQYIHGVPFEQAEQYTSADVPLLLEQLERPAEGVYLPTLVGTLGVIGDTRAIRPLINFIERGRGRLTDDQYGGKKAALLALGHIANKHLSDRAVTSQTIDYLTQGLDPAYWGRVLNWQLPYEGSRETRNWQMVKAAAWGLGLSGHNQGAQVLQQRLERARAADSNVPPDLPDLLQAAFTANGVVARTGLRNYYTRRQ